MTGKVKTKEQLLDLDCAQSCDAITAKLSAVVNKQFRRRGVVVALSGGIDSSVVGALCVRTFGESRVLGLLMPERESAPETLELSRLIARHLGIETLEVDITSTLEALGCYAGRDQAIRSVIPEYTTEYQCKIVLPSLLERERYSLFSVVVRSPAGEQRTERLPYRAYLQILAASNFKQRTRKMIEYYHADRLNYAVTGTPNRLEYDQGFFVKLGDGAADIKPIAHLYKTQVYQLGEFLGLPDAIMTRPPTTDTYSMPQSQEEFYFSVPYDQMDLCLYGLNHGLSASLIAGATGLTEEQVTWVYRDIESKRKATRYQHAAPVLIEDVDQIHTHGFAG
jgi:NAD+ synthase